MNDKFWWAASIIAVVGAGYFFYETLLKNNLQVSEPENQKYHDKSFDCEERIPSVVKSHITRTINDSLKNAVWFEIGKTGQLKLRNNFYKQGKMILLAKSKFREKIIDLETFYQNKYKENSKNSYKNKISNIRMETNDDYFYLYIVVG